MKNTPGSSADRRHFLKTAGLVTASLFAGPASWLESCQAAPTPKSKAETAVTALYDALTDDQKKVICFDWDHTVKHRGLLRTFVSNNWMVTRERIRGDFYTKKQQTIIHDIFKGLINPEWYDRFIQQSRDDSGSKNWGSHQSIAIFGKPGSDQFEFVITGRHMTLRADGNTEPHVAFGGPIFYGHQGERFNEKPDHPSNVFWPQAVAANKVYEMLDGKQRKAALVTEGMGNEADVQFQGKKGTFPGIPVKDLSKDQSAELQKVLKILLDPFRKEDQDEALECLKKQGGLDACSLAFYEEGDKGDDKVWDNWRLEGPSFVWNFRGHPHIHVWVNIADDPSVKLNA